MVILEAPRPTLTFTKIIVSLSIRISVGIEVGELSEPLGFSNHLPTSGSESVPTSIPTDILIERDKII